MWKLLTVCADVYTKYDYTEREKKKLQMSISMVFLFHETKYVERSSIMMVAHGEKVKILSFTTNPVALQDNNCTKKKRVD
jgi:hypothetical protein